MTLHFEKGKRAREEGQEHSVVSAGVHRLVYVELLYAVSHRPLHGDHGKVLLVPVKV